MPFRIAVIPGDGIGPEVIAQGIRVLQVVTAATGTDLDFVSYDLGADRYLRTGEILHDPLFRELEQVDGIYRRPVGDPRVQNPQYAAGLLLRLRFELDLWVNLRPSRLLAPGLTPLRDAASIDLVVVRENTEGAYVGIGGQFKRVTSDEIAIQEDVNTRKGVERIIHYAFELGRQRKAAGHPARVTMVDKSNALYHAHDLWQRVFKLEREGAPEIEAEHLFVDAAARQLVKDPSRFDVVVTSNMFGDILSDLASELVGGLGQAPSANINPDNRRGLFEPVHGSAPKHAGKGIANPVGAILAGAMMLRHLGDLAGALHIEAAGMAAARERRTRRDERWKLGAFGYLMPDFGRRVHRGEPLVMAGGRFGIGSSGEMSPAGLKAVAEEAGLELVIVCGDGVGDIFRRNALNLGLHVVQSRAASEDAQEGDVLTFDPLTRRLTNETRGKTYDPVPLTPMEDEIRRSGGIIKVGRREFTEATARPPRIDWPDSKTAKGLTSTEQIVWSHRVAKAAEVRPGGTLRVWCDLLPASDGTAPFSIHTFNQITGGDRIFPRQAAIANDHFVFSGRNADDKQTSIGRDFAQLHDIGKPYYATPGDGIFHFYFPEQGLVVPGAFIPGADSHSRAYGAYGAVGTGVGSTQLGFGWSTGYIYFTPAKRRRVGFTGKLRTRGHRQDVLLALLRRWGKPQAQGMSVEFVDAERQLPIPYRNTVANMMAEAEAQNGIFAPDEITFDWYPRKGITDLPYPPFEPC